MATRQFFKDLTPGEIYWIKSQTTKIQVDGRNLSEPSYLRTLPDGTSPFDNFTPRQRANIFSELDKPAVKTLTRQYDASPDLPPIPPLPINTPPPSPPPYSPPPAARVETPAPAPAPSRNDNPELNRGGVASTMGGGAAATGDNRPQLTQASVNLLNDNRTYSGYNVPNSEVAAYIVKAANERGIDPNVALAVYQAEGRTGYQSGIMTGGNQERSYGPYQLNTTGGLGIDFQNQTGLTAADPNNWKQNVDWALNYAVKSPEGWKPWMGFDKTPYAGQGYKAGIGQNATTTPISTTVTTPPPATIPGATPERQLTEDEKILAKDPGPPRDAQGNLNKNWYKNDQTGEDYYNPFKGVKTNELTNKQQVPSLNPLHDYESYTYNIGLYAISTTAHAELVNNPGSYKPGPGTLLIASGGRQIVGGSNLRNKAFTEDFFFDNLRLTTTINTTQRSGNSNLILCNFTIIEPNGFTLLDRLITAVEKEPINGKSYLHQPYVLEISFLGYKNGVPDPALKGHTKYLPIRLVEVKSRNSHKGTEYTITASPFNHQALNQRYSATPAIFTVKGSTVGELLGTGASTNEIMRLFDAAVADAKARAELIANENRGLDSAGGGPPRPVPYADPNRPPVNANFQVSGITNAINSWYERMQKNGITKHVYAKISVELDPEIRDAKMISISPNTVAQAAPTTPTNNAKNTAQQAAGINKGGLRWDGTAMAVPNGTRVEKLIEFAIRNSSYIADQLKNDPDNRTRPTDATSNQPLKWYKIVPRIKIIDFIPESNTYSLDITYVVKKWIRTSDYPSGPIGRQLGFVKEYNYMYTGGSSKLTGEYQSNRDVLDLQIDFNILYFQPFSIFKEKEQATSTAPGIYDKNQPGYIDTGVSRQPRNEPSKLPYGKLGPPSKKYITNSPLLQSKNSPQSQSAVTAADLQNSLMIGSRGDMVNVKLKIIGDPTLIKQDDIFHGQTLVVSQSDKTPNYSLWTDQGELYIFLNFRSPEDYNQVTGLANPHEATLWSGVYRIITIENTFNQGKFEQTLDIVKLLIDDNARSTVFSTVGQRYNTYTNAGFPQVPAALPSRFSGPNIIKAGTAGLAVGMSSVLNAGSSSGGLVSGLLGQVQSIASGEVKKLVTKELNAVISKGVAELKYIIERPSPEALAKANAEDAARDMEGGPGSETPEAAGGADVTNPPDGAEFNSADASSGVSDSSNYDSLSEAQVGELYGDLSELTDVAADAVEAVAEGAEAVAEGAEVFAEAFDSIGSLFG